MPVNRDYDTIRYGNVRLAQPAETAKETRSGNSAFQAQDNCVYRGTWLHASPSLDIKGLVMFRVTDTAEAEA